MSSISMRNGNYCVSRYIQEISKFEPLPPKKEVELTIRIKQGDQQARKELIEANLRFVVSTAKKYMAMGMQLTDLISEGNLGLIKAAERFDETRGFKFISYAVWWIRQAILQALSEKTRLIRLPSNRIGVITKMTKKAERLEAELERSPKADEIGRLMDISGEEVTKIWRISRKHQSLDSPFRSGEDGSLFEVIEDSESILPEVPVMMRSLEKDVSITLNTLKDRESQVIRMYYGIGYQKPLTLNEIGEKFNLTRERVRQIKESAIRQLRHRSRSDTLRNYL